MNMASNRFNTLQGISSTLQSYRFQIYRYPEEILGESKTRNPSILESVPYVPE